MDVKIKGICY